MIVSRGKTDRGDLQLEENEVSGGSSPAGKRSDHANVPSGAESTESSRERHTLCPRDAAAPTTGKYLPQSASLTRRHISIAAVLGALVAVLQFTGLATVPGTVVGELIKGKVSDPARDLPRPPARSLTAGASTSSSVPTIGQLPSSPLPAPAITSSPSPSPATSSIPAMTAPVPPAAAAPVAVPPRPRIAPTAAARGNPPPLSAGAYTSDAASVSGHTTLGPDTELKPSEFLRSPNGQYTLTMQMDGNLVLSTRYRQMWVARLKSAPAPGSYLVMQVDGNLVVYNAQGPVWASNTDGHPRASLTLQDDGVAVIYGVGTQRIWATNTRNTTLMPGEALRPNEFLCSNNGQYALTMQADGNLALKAGCGMNGARLWMPSGYAPISGTYVSMQSDGNLVIQDNRGRSLWATNTAGQSDSYLLVQDDGHIVIYAPGSRAVWTS